MNNNYLPLQRTKYQEDLINTGDINNNNNNADDHNQEADPDFLYHPDYSTACIFFQNPVTTDNYMLRWRRHPHRHFRPYFPSSTAILSSSIGLLLCHKHSPSTSISTYFVGNPFHDNLYNSFRPFQPHHSDTHAVLAASPNGDFLIICLLPNPTQQGNLYYALEAYSSSRGYWFSTPSCGTHLHGEVDRVVIPNSGVSCRRFAYWLTWLASSRSKMLVLRVDVKSSTDPVKYQLLTYLEMPESVRESHDRVVRMKLGRVGNRLGLVVVNEEEMRVEMYMMKEKGSVKGNEMDDDAVMVEWEKYPGCLEVDVDRRMEEREVEVVGPNRIRCREMPEAMRFESFKMEVVMAVGRGRRLVMWESRRRNRWRTRVVVMGGVASDGAAAYLVERGVPHISTSLLPKIVNLED